MTISDGGIGMSTGNIYMEGPTGYARVCGVTEITDVTTTMDSIAENTPVIDCFAPAAVTMAFQLTGHEKRRMIRMLFGWRAPGPCRSRLLLRVLEMYLDAAFGRNGKELLERGEGMEKTI